MKFRSKLLSTVAAIGLSAAALPAAAVDFLFDATEVPAFGAPTYGTVSLVQNGANVDFTVTLDPEFNFVTTGNHFVFSFNGTGVAASDIINITDLANAQTFSVSTPNAVNPPFGSFNFGIACATGCSNGGSAGGYNDPLKFTVTGATIADFLVLSTNAGNLGPAFFAADVIVTADTQNFGATGAIGVTHAVPEPETYALMLAGLGVMGFMAKRRKAA